MVTTLFVHYDMKFPMNHVNSNNSDMTKKDLITYNMGDERL